MTVLVADIFLLLDHYWRSSFFIFNGDNTLVVMLFKKKKVSIRLKSFLWKTRILSTAGKSTCWTTPVVRNWNTSKRLDSELDAMMYRWSVLLYILCDGWGKYLWCQNAFSRNVKALLLRKSRLLLSLYFSHVMPLYHGLNLL